MVEGRVATAKAAASTSGRKRGAAAKKAPPPVDKDRLTALRAMALHYGNAERMARAENADNLFYPAKNGISAELRLAFLERRPAELAVDRMRAVQESLARAATERPDFWSVVGQIELRVLVAVSAKNLSAEVGDLISDFRDLKARVPARSMWDSVNSEARFTLEPYEASAAPAEQAAAKVLLGALASLVGD